MVENCTAVPQYDRNIRVHYNYRCPSYKANDRGCVTEMRCGLVGNMSSNMNNEASDLSRFSGISSRPWQT